MGSILAAPPVVPEGAVRPQAAAARDAAAVLEEEALQEAGEWPTSPPQL